ncbi:MAG: divalent-cation tolerance protein CutA [Candidatus Woesearchaeota archaeon]
MRLALIHVLCKDDKEAQTISKQLLDKRLVACTNFFSATSNYFWKQELQEEQETVLLLKTLPELVEQARKEILNIHSYETAYVASFFVEVTDAYGQWVLEQTT